MSIKRSAYRRNGYFLSSAEKTLRHVTHKINVFYKEARVLKTDSANMGERKDAEHLSPEGSQTPS